MARFNRIVLAAVAFIFMAEVAAAERAPRAPERGTVEAVKAEADQMAAECKLTADQQATFKEKVQAKVNALEAWLKVNGEKVKAAMDAAKAARAGTDNAAKQKAGADLTALAAERASALAQAAAAILAVLTEEQKIEWEAAKLFKTTVARLKKIALTEEQTAKIKAVCKAAAAELAGLKDDDKKAKQARAAVPAKVKFAIEEVILTPEQKAAVAPAPKPAAKTESTAPAAPEKKPDDASK